MVGWIESINASGSASAPFILTQSSDLSMTKDIAGPRTDFMLKQLTDDRDIRSAVIVVFQQC
jgi:hypothetical protein